MRTQHGAALLAALIAIVIADPAHAQRQARPPAATDPAAAGPDFVLQGEYAGSINAVGRSPEQVGLQVIALGDGKFDAVRNRAELPGSGWAEITKGPNPGPAAK